MLKVRIIPTLLWKNFGLVKGTGFNSWRRVGPVLPAVMVYNQREIDELVLVDIMASQEGNDPDAESISDFSDACFVPLTVGGGISSVRQVQKLLRAGADKISLNTTCYSNPTLVSDVAKTFGTQCVVASIDARRTDDAYRCFSHSGTIDTGKNPVEWARELADRGAGEILLTSIDRDGTMQGYDLELVRSVSAAVSIPVIASGGAGNYEHMCEAILDAGASAVAAASMFHFTEQTPAEAKAWLGKAGIPVRSIYKQEASQA